MYAENSSWKYVKVSLSTIKKNPNLNVEILYTVTATLSLMKLITLETSIVYGYTCILPTFTDLGLNCLKIC